MGYVRPNMGTNVHMSTLSTLGMRLHEVRSRLGYPQSKVAAAIGIADRSYKNYEAGKRELPLSTAIAFCEAFRVDLQWLLLGKPSLNEGQAKQLFEDSVLAVLAESERQGKSLSHAKTAKACAFLATLCLASGAEPASKVGEVMELME
jgi:DNA-binding XRE family transcriptional regulator